MIQDTRITDDGGNPAKVLSALVAPARIGSRPMAGLCKNYTGIRDPSLTCFGNEIDPDSCCFADIQASVLRNRLR
jgi:hypothetical protein